MLHITDQGSPAAMGNAMPEQVSVSCRIAAHGEPTLDKGETIERKEWQSEAIKD